MAEADDRRSEGSDISLDSWSDFDESDGENDQNGNRNLQNDNRENVNRNYQDFAGFFASDSENEDSDFEGFDADWIRDGFTARNTRDFTENGGIFALFPDDARALQYFQLIWTDELWDYFVIETNRYANEERTRNPPPPGAPGWANVDKDKLKAFVGLCIVMGILRLPHRNDYWRVSKRMYKTSFNDIMPRDEFNQIWRYMHLHNRQAPRPEVPDKLEKIRWYIDFLNDKFTNLYIPYGNVTIDESMVKFKGRLSFRQYLPSKPIKWGVKVWVLAESTTGYISRFQIYTGKEANQEKGLSHRVVLDLMSNFQQKNLKLYFDNFYTGVDLMSELLIRGIYACGTVRANRKGLPVELLPKNVHLQKHDFRVAQKNELTFCHWMDTKPVLALSNFHDPQAVGIVNRRSGHNLQRQVRVPKMLEDYQKHMKGVDLADQMVGYYMLHHRSRKWWRRLFFYFLMVSAHNAYIMAKDSCPETAKKEWPNFQDFLEELSEDLIGEMRAGRDAPNLNAPRPAGRHDIRRLYPRKKVCVECRALGVRQPTGRTGSTYYGCVQCDTAVHQAAACIASHIGRANNA